MVDHAFNVLLEAGDGSKMYSLLTGPCSKNDSGYIGKLEILKIKKPSCFDILIPRYIQE